MRTDDLIAELTQSPWPKVRPGLRIAVATFGGWLVALTGLVLVFGSPMKSVALTGAMPFATKMGYPLALAALSIVALVAAGRPGQRLSPRAGLILIPLGVLGIAAGTELVFAAPAEWPALLFGSTFLRCLTAITLASLPILAAVIWAYRILAPTQLALAGFLAGLSSGAAAAVAYALYCPETTASFLIGSYTPAILVPAMIGAFVGSRLMRW